MSGVKTLEVSKPPLLTCCLLREALPDLPTQTVPVTALRAGGKVRTPGPGCREGASSPAGQAGLGFLWSVTASWSPLFVSLQPPQRLFSQAGSWAQSLPRPTLTLVSGGSWLSPLRQVRGHGLSTWHPAPPRGNLQTSVVHCRELASCEAGAAASLCLGSGGSAAQKVPETTGYPAAFLLSGDRNQLWLKSSQGESETGQGGGMPARVGQGWTRRRPVGARARQLGGAAERNPVDALVGTPVWNHPTAVVWLSFFFSLILFFRLFLLKKILIGG